MSISSLNAVCPYFTMFPLEFPMRVLAKEQSSGRWVYDPFCGRGTTNFAARLRGLPSVGIDSSSVAIAIAEAKVVTTSFQAVIKCAKAILNESLYPEAIPSQSFWRWAYSENTLLELCRIREELIRNCKSPTRKVLRAIILGALHGPRCKGMPSYFSNQCPRTFAPKPAYAMKFWKQRNMKAPVVDVLGIIHRRAERFLSTGIPNVNGIVLQRDSREWTDTDLKGLFSWVITSPPYYGMRTYIPDQWLRNWFMGGPATVDYGPRPTDFQHSSPEQFSQQLRQVWLNAASMSTASARLACRFGGIHDRRQDCIEILKSSFRNSGWRLTTIRDAGSALDGRRQAMQFGEDQKKRPRQEYDAYARRDD
jgi:DNA methylase